jgi:hypothetical protein
MKKRATAYVLSDHLMEELIKVARKNWNDWRDVFECGGAIDEHPLLTCPERFASFCGEYSVNRTLRAGKRDELRLKLNRSRQFGKVLEDDSGRSLDRLEEKLRPRFATKQGENRMVSVLSKIAAFVKPERFVAWDRFAKKGLNKVLGCRASFPFRSYAEYLGAFDCAWYGLPGQKITEHVRARRVGEAVEGEPRFLRRVLDVYLMKCGDRWSQKDWHKLVAECRTTQI